MAINVEEIDNDPNLKNNSAYLNGSWNGENLSEVVDFVAEKAKSSPTGRFNLMVHKSLDEETQVIINGISKQSYVRPHRHNGPDDRTEIFSIQKGKMKIILFKDGGEIEKVVDLDAGDPEKKIFEVKTGQIHTVISGEEGVVVFELKEHPKGGYNPEKDKEFASWAPLENSDAAPKYFKSLLKEIEKPR